MICLACIRKDEAVTRAEGRIAFLEAELGQAKQQLEEMTKLSELQAADLDRYKKAMASQEERHQPERVSKTQLQLALERVLAAVTDKPTKDALEKDVETASNDDAPPRPRRSGGRRKILARRASCRGGAHRAARGRGLRG